MDDDGNGMGTSNNGLLRGIYREVGVLAEQVKELKEQNAREHAAIEKRLENGSESFEEMRLGAELRKALIAYLDKDVKTNKSTLDDLKIGIKNLERKYGDQDKKIGDLEKRTEGELSRNSKLQILANLIISIVNIFVTALTKLTGG